MGTVLDLMHDLFLGVSMAIAFLCAPCIAMLIARVRMPKDECARCMCRDVCSQLGEEK